MLITAVCQACMALLIPVVHKTLSMTFYMFDSGVVLSGCGLGLFSRDRSRTFYLTVKPCLISSLFSSLNPLITTVNISVYTPQ